MRAVTAIKSTLAAGLLWTTAANADKHPAAEIPFDPLALYGQEMLFDVFRGGERVGFHHVRFLKTGSDLSVSNIFELEIKVLFLTAFAYSYQSDALWRDGELVDLKVRVDDDGELFELAAVRADDRVEVINGVGRYDVKPPVFPTNHWNPAVLGQQQVLNTLTGKLNNVSIGSLGRERVATERGEVAATRYAYRGDLETEVWYDDQGRWVKLKFRGRDGSTIEYVCRRCQGGPGGAAAE